MRSSFLLLGAATAGVLAIPTTDHVVHERRDFLPSHWTEEGRLDGDAVLPVRIGLTQSNMDRGHDMLMDLYVPFEFVTRSFADCSGRILVRTNMASICQPKTFMTCLLRRRTA